MAITHSEMKKALGLKLLKLRKQRRMKQIELADALSLTAEACRNLERGLSFPSIPTLIKLSEVFGLSVDSLLDNESDGEPSEKMRPAIYRLAEILAGLDDGSRRQVMQAVPLVAEGPSRSRVGAGHKPS